MNRERVLVFPAGTEIAFEIFNALKYSKYIELYGANSRESHAEFVFEHCVSNLPYEDDPAFISKLNKAIEEWKIDLVYPAHDSALLTLTKEQKNINARVVTSPLETVRVCRSKKETYNYFKGEEFVPKSFNNLEDVDSYPVFIKPDVGQGAVGARIVETEEKLKDILNNGTTYAICEYLPGEEYTADCFTDKNGRLRSCHLRNRERIRTGIAVRSSLVTTDDKIMDIANIINNRLVFNGAWFFQVKKNTSGDYRLMEVSPRIPGTMGTSRNLGINYPMLTIYNTLGYDVDIIDNDYDITLDRAFISRYKTGVKYKKVYIDFDDTLYIGNKVNVFAIAFLYQCLNKGIPVILLTKHSSDIYDSLKRFRISADIFDRIIHINKNEEKSDYIDKSDAILIDDSFSERKRVREKRGIPVYDLDMIESLIDWRR